MNTRLCIPPTIGLLLLLGVESPAAADAEEEAAIAAIQKVGGTVSGNPPEYRDPGRPEER